MLWGSLVLLVLAFGPGGIVALAATPRHSRLRRVAVAASPSVTYGLVGGAVGWSTLLGRTWPPLGVLTAEVGLAALAVSARVIAGAAGRAPGAAVRSLTIGNRLRAHRRDIIALAASVTATLTVSWLVLGRLGSPPGWDSMNHAFMARRIIDTGSASPSDVCVTGSVLPAPACTFYPLAPHVVWAQAVELTGLRLSTVMLATTMVIMPVTGAIGVFAIVRICRGGSVLAACAAFLPSLVGPMWPSLVTGRITILLGAALASSAALLLWLAIRSPAARALSAVAAVGVAGVALAHTYDLIGAAMVALGLLVARPPRQSLRTWVLRVLGIGLGALLVLFPQGPGLLAARGERGVSPPRHPGQVWSSLAEWVFSPGQYLATVVARPVPGAETTLTTVAGFGAVVSLLVTLGWVAGLFLCFASPRLVWARPFAVAQLLTLVLAVTIDTGTGPLRNAVGALFYGDPRRPLWSNVAAPGVLCLAGWVAAGIGAWMVLRRIPRLSRARIRSWVAPLVVTTAIAGLVACVPDTWQAQTRLAGRSLPAGPAYQRVGSWLRAHGGGVVADDVHRDFVTWLNADSDLPVLRGMVPLDPASNPDWTDRTRVWNALAWTKRRNGTCLLDRFDVRWLVVSDLHMPGGHRTYRPQRLADESPYLRLAHADGPLKVYAVDHLCGTGR
ncbi:DUF6541 family protein [Pedococcus sp. 5OH_020]|uniref:DUF6541 family protein n=1 Tax=Pedococcus sp. 5OH_020 TaxID=2989814 RepID=UPI0022E9F43C|nr:DUF6541 family protein [Pedococcus sp. 5OH_020]